MRFEVLGPLRLIGPEGSLPLGGGRQRALLARLLVAGGRTVSSDGLIDSVWGEALPSNPTNTLQQAVAQLRKLLEPERRRDEAPAVVLSDGGGYRLAIDGHESDAADLAAAVDTARHALDAGDGTAAVAAATEALALWRGPAYADVAALGFVVGERDRLDELRSQAQELEIDGRLLGDGPGSVVADLEALVVEAPLREGRWGRLMAALYQTGRQAEALRVYQRAADSLRDGLGIDPGPELRDLEARILAQDPDLLLPSPEPGPSSAATPTSSPSAAEEPEGVTHNLPYPTTSLVGRDVLVDEVIGALSTARLVTLLGPGGSGKTRLAIEVGHRLVTGAASEPLGPGRGPGCVVLVRLDDLTDPALLATTLASAFGVASSPERTVVAALAELIGSHPIVVVLDNCEHLVTAAADVVAELLARCPNLAVLATSQEALAVDGEHRIPVPPLALPSDAAGPFDDLGSSPAVELFLDRAAAAGYRPDADSPETLNAVANIVTALDGIPLAIELAAAQTDVLEPVELAVRLADRFDLLTSGRRGGPERQQTLRAAVDWSFGLLDDDAQRFFVDLAVCAGSFDLATAMAVTNTDEAAALDAVSHLVRRSLLVRDEGVGTTSRYRMLETMRHYGQRRGAEDGRAAARHAALFARRTVELDQRLTTGDQRAAFATFAADEDNLRAALGWGLAAGELDVAVRMAAHAGRYWDWRGSVAEATTWLGRLADATLDTDQDQPELGLVLSWYGFFLAEMGDLAAARHMADRARAVAEAQNDRYAQAIAATGDALYARLEGHLEEAFDHGDRIRRSAAQLDDGWLHGWADNHDAVVLLALGRLDEADEAAARSRRHFESRGDARSAGWAATAQAQVALERGDHALADELGCRAATISIEAGDGRNGAWALEIAASAARRRGDEARAAQLDQQVAELMAARGVPTVPWRWSGSRIGSSTD